MMWCPICLSEYREGFTVCADCGSELVEECSREMLSAIAEAQAANKVTPRKFLRKYRPQILFFAAFISIYIFTALWDSFATNQGSRELPILDLSSSEVSADAPEPQSILKHTDGFISPKRDSFHDDPYTINGPIRDFVQELVETGNSDEVRLAPEFAQEVERFKNGLDADDEVEEDPEDKPRYEVQRTPTEQSALEIAGDSFISEHMVVLDNYTNSVLGDGIILTRPKGAEVSLHITASGQLYVRVDFKALRGNSIDLPTEDSEFGSLAFVAY